VSPASVAFCDELGSNVSCSPIAVPIARLAAAQAALAVVGRVQAAVHRIEHRTRRWSALPLS